MDGWNWPVLLSNGVLQEYQRYFHKTKEKLEQTPSERQFDFSEMYIFGKFDTFQRRLNKILEMFETMSTYSALQDSKIEGLETMATRFQVSILLDQTFLITKWAIPLTDEIPLLASWACTSSVSHQCWTMLVEAGYSHKKKKFDISRESHFYMLRDSGHKLQT